MSGGPQNPDAAGVMLDDRQHVHAGADEGHGLLPRKALDDALPLPLDVLPLDEAVALLRKAARIDDHPRDEPLLAREADALDGVVFAHTSSATVEDATKIHNDMPSAAAAVTCVRLP